MSNYEKKESAPTRNQTHSNVNCFIEQMNNKSIPRKKRKNKFFKFFQIFIFIVVVVILTVLFSKYVKSRDEALDEMFEDYEYGLMHDDPMAEPYVHITNGENILEYQQTETDPEYPLPNEYEIPPEEWPVPENRPEEKTEAAVEEPTEEPTEEPEDQVDEKNTVRYSLTDAERQEIASVVTAESETECFAGKMAVAQCILQATEDDGIRPVEAIKAYKYAKSRPEPSEEAILAVSAVFDDGWVATTAPIKYFYDPSLCTSSWHESQDYCMTIGCHRFFAEKGTKKNRIHIMKSNKGDK